MLKSMLAFVATALLTGWFTFHPHLDDDANFATLLASSDPTSRVEAGGLVTYCQQFREGVSKEIAMNDHTCTITSDNSELFLFNHNGEFEVIEESDKIHATLDDNTIDAQNACYNYNTNTLSTKDATLTKKGTVVKSDAAHYNGHQLILSGNVSVDSEMGHVTADKAIVDHENKSPSKITLNGHVNMTNGEQTQFAMADHVDYFPDEKVMIFESDERVLFYDREKQMQLSAKKVRAHRGLEDEVQGYGNVCFVFGTEELDKLKKQFKWES